MSKKGATPTQLTLVVINLLFVAAGIAAIAAACWVLIYGEHIVYLTLIDVATNNLGLLQNAAILLIVSGVVVFFLGFVGCCATFKDRRCLRVVYIGMVSLCCVVTLAGCVIAFLYRDQMEEKLVSHLETKLKTEYQGYASSTMDFSQALDYAQVEFECCGIRSYTDFTTAEKWTVRNSATVPPTCCIMKDKQKYLDYRFITLQDEGCVQNPLTTNSHIQKPCAAELKNWIERGSLIMGGIAVAAVVLEILAVIFLIGVMRKQGKDMDYRYRSNLYLDS